MEQGVRHPSITRVIGFFPRLISTVFGLWNCPLSSPLSPARFRFRQSLSRDATALSHFSVGGKIHLEIRAVQFSRFETVQLEISSPSQTSGCSFLITSTTPPP